jgi:hypothetical protein
MELIQSIKKRNMQICLLFLPFYELFEIFHHESQRNSNLNFETVNGKNFYCTPLGLNNELHELAAVRLVVVFLTRCNG